MRNKNPIFVPAWLQDRDGVAPCPCGQPRNNEVMEATHTDGLKRWFHLDCWWLAEMMANEEDDEET